MSTKRKSSHPSQKEKKQRLSKSEEMLECEIRLCPNENTIPTGIHFKGSEQLIKSQVKEFGEKMLGIPSGFTVRESSQFMDITEFDRIDCTAIIKRISALEERTATLEQQVVQLNSDAITGRSIVLRCFIAECGSYLWTKYNKIKSATTPRTGEAWKSFYKKLFRDKCISKEIFECLNGFSGYYDKVSKTVAHKKFSMETYKYAIEQETNDTFRKRFTLVWKLMNE